MAFQNLEEIVKAWALDSYLQTNDGNNIDEETITLEVNWDRVKFKHGEADFPQEFHNAGKPKTQVLFTSTYKNGSDSTQSYNFQVEKTTTSSLEIGLTKCMQIGGEKVKLDVKLPREILYAMPSLKKKLVVSNMNGETFSEQIKWTVNQDIIVPEKSSMKVSLIVGEKDHASPFSIKTTLSGEVHVAVTRPNRYGNPFTRSLTGAIAEVVNSKLPDHLNGNPNSGWEWDVYSQYVSYITHGTCKFNYGIDQYVDIQPVKGKE